MKVILLITKFGLLAVLYLFIFRVFQFIQADLRHTLKDDRRKEQPNSTIGAELAVVDSNDPALQVGKVVQLGEVTTIGRGGQNQIKMSDTFASHDHAKIYFKHENFFLEDLNSINGTYINGIRAQEAVPLRHGDAFTIAGVTFKFVRWKYEVE